MSVQTEAREPDLPRRSNDDDGNDEFFGFADKPYDEPPPAASQPNGDIPVTIDNTDVEAARLPPPVTPTNNTNTNTTVQSGNSGFQGFIAFLMLTLPWASSMALSWSVLTRIKIEHAPREVILSCVASAMEVGAILLFCVGACCGMMVKIGDRKAEGRPDRPHTWQERIFYSWLWFLFLDPIATGIYVWCQASLYKCHGTAQTARCQVGQTWITAIAVYRVFGV
ncbi:hypothetical protein G7046_g5871 [Stylonectria norvegica]|nr:hypothetical protein G7046_g5871 [Stylonectria norvegica]